MYPEIGLPDRVTVVRYAQTSVDSDDNPVYTPSSVISDRPARFYRDQAKDSKYVRDGFTLKGMVTFKYHSGDAVLDADEIQMAGPEFTDIGNVFQVVYASLKMSWKRPSHWEIGLGVQA